MKLIIDIPEEIYQNAKTDMLCGSEVIVNAIKNGIPQEPKTETVTEFADRCKECGARYGRLLQQEPKTDILDKIRAEIMSEIVWHIDQNQEDCAQVLTSAIEVIDKYRNGGE